MSTNNQPDAILRHRGTYVEESGDNSVQTKTLHCLRRATRELKEVEHWLEEMTTMTEAVKAEAAQIQDETFSIREEAL